MAPPRNSELLQRYSGEMGRSKKWRTNDYDDRWSRMRDLFRGKQWESGGDADQLVVNMSFATINVIGPSVSVSNPRFTVSARQPDKQPQAMITEEVINYLWRTNKYHAQFRLCVNDWLIFGHGWMKVGYKFVTEPKVVKEPDDPDDDEGIDDREDKDGNVETETNVLDDRPFTERISPFDIFVDPDARTMDDLRWIAQRIRRPVADVRVDRRYSPTVRRDTQASTTSRYPDDEPTIPSSHAPVGARDAGYVDVIEYYDLRRKTYSVFGDGATEGFLIKPETMPYAFGHPFLMLRNYEVPDEFYPMGELESIETLQLELNETRTQMLNHRKRGSRKYLYMEDAFEAAGIDALESDEDNTLVPVNAGQDIGRVIIPMPAIGTPPEFYNQSEMIQADIDKVTGTSDYMRGNMPDIRRTATEAAMVQDAQNSRSQDKMTRVENFLSLLGERIIQLMQQYMTGEQVVRVVGANAVPIWITYDKDYIQGEFDLDVEAGSTQPQNETFKRQSAMQMVDAMAPFAAAGVINEEELAKYVLQMGFGVKNPEAFVHPQEPPPGAAPPGGGGPPPGPPAPDGGGGGPPPPEAGVGPPPGAAPAPPPGAPPAGGGMGVEGIPPEMLEQLQAFMQSLPPEGQQMLIQELSKVPPEKRVQFIATILQQVGQNGPPPGAAPVGAPPPGAVPVGGPPPMGP